MEGEKTAVYPLHSETAPGLESHLSESGIARTDFEFAETGRTGGLRCMAQHRTAYPCRCTAGSTAIFTTSAVNGRVWSRTYSPTMRPARKAP